MLDDEYILNLLILESSSNEAEAITSILRNAGLSVRAHFTQDIDELDEALQEQRPDLILCSDSLEEFSPGQVLNRLHQRNISVPLIIISEALDEAKTISALQIGARDLVSKASPQHLQLVVAREAENMRQLGELTQYRSNYQESERRCHSLLDSSRDAIAYVHEGMHIYTNPTYLEMFGYTDFDDVECMTLMDLIATEDQARFKRFLRDYGKGMDVGNRIEVMAHPSVGGDFKATMEFAPATVDGEPCTQVIIRAQVMDKELEDKIKYLSKQDLLTGLYNRQYFMGELETSIEQVVSKQIPPGGLFYILIDNFKDIRDRAGIAGSDLVLSDIAKVLRGKIDSSMLLARFGDSSFTLMALDKTHQELLELAESIHTAIDSNTSEVVGQQISTHCSIGISLIGTTSTTAHDALTQADLACDMARQQGSGHIHLHNPVEDQAAGQERNDFWGQQLNHALDNNQFRLVFQPIVSLHGAAKENYEVLVRLLDENGDEISPGKFMPAAEQAGLTGKLDRWVISRSIEILAEQHGKGHQTHFFIKLSAASLMEQEATLIAIRDGLQQHRIPGDAITFEITEGDALDHLTVAKPLLNTLHELRCSLALEHFGKHNNAFALLKHLPIDILKIDGSFIHHLASSHEKQAKVKGIADEAKALGKQTIAEFVEDANSLSVLWQCGVNYIQGYFLQAPDEVLAYDFGG